MGAFVDFVEQQRRNVFDPPVRSLMDIDFYKFTMGQLIWKHFRDVTVVFRLINRDPSVPLASVVPEGELIKYLDYARRIRFSYSDLAWLRGMRVYGANMFAEGYMEFLEKFSLPPYKLSRRGDQYVLAFEGAWPYVSMWETLALAIISELYYRNLMRAHSRYELDVLYSRGKARLWEKFERIVRCPSIRVADFCQRRRHSFLWQDWAVGAAKEMLKAQFVGTSNTWMARQHDLMPIGTSAHELLMVVTALASDDEKRDAQYKLFHYWSELYGPGLRVFLPDTYMTKTCLERAPVWLAKEWRGMRQDSGDPIRIGHMYIEWLKLHGVNPKDKLIVFSDGLDVDPMIRLVEEFSDQINVAFGWGTLLGNDFRGCLSNNPLFKPFSLVCKVVQANGRPAVKLSDNIEKATGSSEEIGRYLNIFGVSDRDNIKVVV